MYILDNIFQKININLNFLFALNCKNNYLFKFDQQKKIYKLFVDAHTFKNMLKIIKNNFLVNLYLKFNSIEKKVTIKILI